MAHPPPLFEPMWSPGRELARPEFTSALEVGAVVAIGVSGSKDSAATVLATMSLQDALSQQTTASGDGFGHDVPALEDHDIEDVVEEWRPT